MVEVKELVKRYGGKTALNGVSFTINDGEIVGFLGPNGAGKSTTMNIITGYISASSGSVKVDGHDILKEPLKVKSRVGYLPEQPPLYVDMTVKGYLGFMYDLKKVKLEKWSHIEEICEKVGVTDVYERIIKKLSKGYKQRVGLAQALLGYPPVIILDEPTVGLDPRQIIEIRNLIKGLAKDHTVILSSHILSEVQAVCGRIIVINKGKLVADGTTEEITENARGRRGLVMQVDGEEGLTLDVLGKINGISKAESTGKVSDGVYGYLIEYEDGTDVRRDIFKEFAKHDLPIVKLDEADSNLEDAFLKLIDSGDAIGDKTGADSPEEEGAEVDEGTEESKEAPEEDAKTSEDANSGDSNEDLRDGSDKR